MELLDCMVVLFLIFWGISILFSIMAARVYIPTNSAWGLLFSTSLPTLVNCCFFNNTHSDRREVTFHCDLDLYFLDDWWCQTSFRVSVGRLCVFFGKMSLQVLCPFLNCIIWGLILSYVSSLCVLFINPLSDI